MLQEFGSSAWRRLRNEVKPINGVIYSTEIDLEVEYFKQSQRQINSWLPQNTRRDTIPKECLIQINEQESKGLDDLDRQPYTFWERTGLMPLAPSRVRPRQYYYPITDFALYNYDEMPPEEQELRAKWISRLYSFSFVIPIFSTSLLWTISSVFGRRTQASVALFGGAASIFIEFWRTYSSAMEERQDLDDYVLAKEIWYMKNVETYQLEIPRIPHGREKEFHQLVDFRTNLLKDAAPSNALDSVQEECQLDLIKKLNN